MKKRVLRNSAKFTGKHLCQNLFFNKVFNKVIARYIIHTSMNETCNIKYCDLNCKKCAILRLQSSRQKALAFLIKKILATEIHYSDRKIIMTLNVYSLQSDIRNCMLCFNKSFLNSQSLLLRIIFIQSRRHNQLCITNPPYVVIFSKDCWKKFKQKMCWFSIIYLHQEGFTSTS